MVRSEERNIFDMAGKGAPKKKHKQAGPSHPKSEPVSEPEPAHEREAAPAPPPAPPPSEKRRTYTNDEIRQMIDKMHSMHRELSEKLEKAFEARKLTPEALEKILAMTNADLLVGMKERIKALEDQIYAIVGRGAIEVAAKRKLAKAAKKQKGKTMGSRRGWISMG